MRDRREIEAYLKERIKHFTELRKEEGWEETDSWLESLVDLSTIGWVLGCSFEIQKTRIW